MSTFGARRPWRLRWRAVLISAAITVVMAATVLAVTGYPLHTSSAAARPSTACAAPTGKCQDSVTTRPVSGLVEPIQTILGSLPGRLPLSPPRPVGSPPTSTAAPNTTLTVSPTTAVTSPTGSRAPASPPVTWCESGFSDPYTSAPPRAVTIPAGDNSDEPFMANYTAQPNTTYWFAPGTHTLGSGLYAQISVDDGDTFVGAPGAIIDGDGVNDYAFVENAPVTTSQTATIEYLTIKDFVAGTGEAVVGQGGYTGWTVRHDLVEDNPYGAGVAIGSEATVSDNCLTDNGEYGYTAFGNEHDVTFTGNDVSDNNEAGYYDVPGSKVQCGCSGGGKFWDTTNAVVTGNYIHDNNGVGIWVDTDNAGFLISGNYISGNRDQAIMYEISYNAQITDNTLVANTIGEGASQATPGFPDGAIYISESGADPRVTSNYSAGPFLISGNILTDNWGGVVLWENANRYCSDGSDGACTLVDPSLYTMASCGAHLSEQTPTDYYDNCRWKTENVQVSHNTITFDPAKVSPACSVATMCGFTGLFSNYGNAPYDATRTVAVTFGQNNHFTDNTYLGPVSFFAWSQSNEANPVSWSAWTAPVTDQCDTPGEIAAGTCDSGFGQDTGSTYKP